MASPFQILSNSLVSSVPPPESRPRPPWLRVRFFGGPNYQDLKRIMRTLDLNTVCESARCPNMGECWEHRTATFMILGNVCTRACGFCAVPPGKPVGPPDADEPRRVAEAVEKMGLRYVVVTSVNRDDQLDGGAGIFARTMEEMRRRAVYERSLGLLRMAKTLAPEMPTKTGLMLGLGETREEVLTTMTDLVT